LSIFFWISAHELHQDEIEKLRAIFYRLDSDNDGEITWREMKAGFLELNSTPPEDVHKLFENFIENEAEEHDDNEIIPYSFFLAATMDHHILRSIDRLHEAFHSFDPDDTGTVDLHVVLDLLDQHNTKKHGADVSSIGIEFKNRERSESKVGDTHRVTFEEFCGALTAFHKNSTTEFNLQLESKSNEENHKHQYNHKSHKVYENEEV
jgi:Ca2+-binding EF-hand superfamily protein